MSRTKSQTRRFSAVKHRYAANRVSEVLNQMVFPSHTLVTQFLVAQEQGDDPLEAVADPDADGDDAAIDGGHDSERDESGRFTPGGEEEESA